MANPEAHPLAAHHIPTYVVQADGSDYLFTFMLFFTVGIILIIGIAYFTLHAIPEKMAHKSNHPQFQLVGILALLALFTHNGLFWVAAILVAGFQIPDLSAPLRSIAEAIRSLSPGRTPMATAEPAPAAASTDTTDGTQ